MTKIGKTNHLFRRLVQLKAKFKISDLELVNYFKGDLKLENELHMAYKVYETLYAKSFGNEWFEFSKSFLEEIKKVRNIEELFDIEERCLYSSYDEETHTFNYFVNRDIGIRFQKDVSQEVKREILMKLKELAR